MRIVLCTLCVHCVRACVCGHTGGIQERLKARLEGAFDECGLEFQRFVRGIVVLYTRMNHHGLFHMLVMLVEKMSIMLVMVVACCLVAGCSSRCRPRCSLCRQWHLRSAPDGVAVWAAGVTVSVCLYISGSISLPKVGGTAVAVL